MRSVARSVQPFAARLEVALIAGACALAAAYELTHEHPKYAVALCVLPIIAWALPRPAVLLVVLGASIPLLIDIQGGIAGFHLGVTDVLMVLVAVSILFAAATGLVRPILQALRPVAFPVVQYAAFVIVLLPFHPLTLSAIGQSGQRLELLLLPLAIGAFAALEQKVEVVLKAYVAAATGIAVLWPVAHLSLDHNPVGQMIGNAILVTLGYSPLRKWRPTLVVLIPGLLITQSRGAIVATAVGLVVMSLLQGNARVRGAFRRLIPVAIVAAVAFFALPASFQTRVTTFQGSLTSKAAYPIFLRHHYTADAAKIISAHPFTGVGIGDYAAADAQSIFAVNDPHEVLYLQAAEGGYGFAVSFVILVGLTFLAMRRMKGVELAPIAAGVLVATVVHGLADVYWVRGTPVLGWMLVGMACGELYRRRRGDPALAD
jgi:hypothetical protein